MSRQVQNRIGFHFPIVYSEPKRSKIPFLPIMPRSARQKDIKLAYAPPGCLAIALRVIFWSVFWVSLFFAFMWEASSLAERKLDGLSELLVSVCIIGVPVLYLLIASELAKRAPFPLEMKALLQTGWQEKLWTDSREARVWLQKSHNLHVSDAIVEYWVKTLQQEAFISPPNYEKPEAWVKARQSADEIGLTTRVVVNPSPVWQHSFALSRWQSLDRPSHDRGNLVVELLPHSVICSDEAPRPWFCLDRNSGALLWERKVGRPNTVIGVDNGVIVATELRRNDSPLIWNYGIYGLSLQTGELLWTSHGKGWWGRFTRFLDFVPDFRNELRDTPVYLDSGAIVTESGRLVSPADGSDIGTTEIARSEYIKRGSAEFQLRLNRSLDCGEYGTLRAGTPDNPEMPVENRVGFMPTRLFLEDEQGNALWTLDLSDLPHTYSSLTFEYQSPHLYFRVASPLSLIGKSAFDQPEYYSIWIVDIRTGAIVQRLPIGEMPLFNCILQCVDDDHLLVSYGNANENTQMLVCYSREKEAMA